MNSWIHGLFGNSRLGQTLLPSSEIHRAACQDDNNDVCISVSREIAVGEDIRCVSNQRNTNIYIHQNSVDLVCCVVLLCNDLSVFPAGGKRTQRLQGELLCLIFRGRLSSGPFLLSLLLRLICCFCLRLFSSGRQRSKWK